MGPLAMKAVLNLYPPYLGTGIVVKRISPDYREIVVQMKLRWYNRNYRSTHFGGSLYAMTDPFYMLMLIRILGKGYDVWDKTGRIEFVKPGRGTVTARFAIDDARLADIYAHTAGGDKYLPDFSVDVTDEQGNTVARVVKTLYIRKKA